MAVEREKQPFISKSVREILRFIERNYKSPKERNILIVERWAEEKFLHYQVDIATLVKSLAKNITNPYWFFAQPVDYPYWVATEETTTPDGSSDIIIFPREEKKGWASFFKNKPFTMKEVLRNDGQWGTARAFQKGDFLPQNLPVGYESGLIIWRAREDDLLDMVANGLNDSGLRQGKTKKEFLLDTLLAGTEFYYVLLPDWSMKEHFLAMPEAGMAVD